MPMMARADSQHPDTHCARAQQKLQHAVASVLAKGITNSTTATATLKVSCQRQTGLLQTSLFIASSADAALPWVHLMSNDNDIRATLVEVSA